MSCTSKHPKVETIRIIDAPKDTPCRAPRSAQRMYDGVHGVHVKCRNLLGTANVLVCCLLWVHASVDGVAF